MVQFDRCNWPKCPGPLEQSAEGVRVIPQGVLVEDWREFLNPAPVSDFQRSISIQDTKGFLSIVGYLTRIDSKGRSNIGGTPDLHFREYLRTSPAPTFDSDKYCVTKDTHYNTNLSALKYDVQPALIEDLDPELFQAALQDTIKCYSVLQDSCRILDFEELEYVPGTSPGFKYKLAGCSTKEDAVSAFRAQLRRSWDEHHVRRVPCLWKQAGKIELLKREKVDVGDLRGFTCPELDFLFCCMRMNYDFNKKLHSFAHNFMATMSRVGYVLQKGGFTTLFRRHHRPGCECGEGDCKKFDSNIAALFFYVSMMVRYDAWDKKGMTPEEWFKRQKWYFEQKCYSFILLPSGQVVMTITGNKSGQDSTTDDNGISHTFTLCYAWRKLFRRPLWACFDTVNIDLYADDHLFSVPPQFYRFSDFETRRALYAELGLTLAKDKDFVTTGTAEGHTFLGPKAVMQGGRLVPVYNRDKVLCSVLYMEHEYPPDVQLGRVLSIMLNCVFDRPVFDYLRKYAFHLREIAHGALTLPDAIENVSFLWLLSIPSASEVESFWLGNEHHS